MSGRATFTVRRVRADGTVTFNGARMSEGAAVRERDAWRDHGGTLVATVLPEGNDVTRREVRAWRVAVKAGQPFYGLTAAAERPACGNYRVKGVQAGPCERPAGHSGPHSHAIAGPNGADYGSVRWNS